MTYGTLIQTITVGAGGANNITFSSIPQTFTDLCVVISSRITTAGMGAYQPINVYLENPGAVNGGKRLLGDGSLVSSDAPSYIQPVSMDSNATANTFSSNSIYICNYIGMGRKPVSVDGVAGNNSVVSLQFIQAGLSEGGSAITQIQLAAQGTFAQYSTASLYGLTHF